MLEGLGPKRTIDETDLAGRSRISSLKPRSPRLLDKTDFLESKESSDLNLSANLLRTP